MKEEFANCKMDFEDSLKRSELKVDLSKKDLRVKTFQMDTLQKRSIAQDVALRQVNVEKFALKAESQKLQKEAVDERSWRAEMIQKQNILEEEVNHFRKLSTESSDKCAILMNEIDELKSDRRELVLNSEARIKEADALVAEVDSKKDMLEKELKESRRLNDDFKNELAGAAESTAETQSEMALIKDSAASEIGELRGLLEKELSRRERAESRLTQLKTLYDDCEIMHSKQVGELKLKIETRDGTLAKLYQSTNAMRVALTKAQSRCKDLAVKVEASRQADRFRDGDSMKNEVNRIMDYLQSQKQPTQERRSESEDDAFAVLKRENDDLTVALRVKTTMLEDQIDASRAMKEKMVGLQSNLNAATDRIGDLEEELDDSQYNVLQLEEQLEASTTIEDEMRQFIKQELKREYDA
jgi:chromosome segregation ATPase